MTPDNKKESVIIFLD